MSQDEDMGPLLHTEAPPGGWPWQLDMWTDVAWKTTSGKRVYMGKCKICGFVQTKPTTLVRVANHYGTYHA